MLDVPELTLSDAQVEALAEWVQPLFDKLNALMAIAHDPDEVEAIAEVSARKFAAWFAGLRAAGYADQEFERVIERGSEISLAKIGTKAGQDKVLADALALLLPTMARKAAAA